MKWHGHGKEIYLNPQFHSLVQAILAIVKGSRGEPRISRRVLKRAVLHFYSQHRLFPRGVVAELPAVQSWAEKMAKALKRLEPWHLIKFFWCDFF